MFKPRLGGVAVAGAVGLFDFEADADDAFTGLFLGGKATAFADNSGLADEVANATGESAFALANATGESGCTLGMEAAGVAAPEGMAAIDATGMVAEALALGLAPRRHAKIATAITSTTLITIESVRLRLARESLRELLQAAAVAWAIGKSGAPPIAFASGDAAGRPDIVTAPRIREILSSTASLRGGPKGTSALASSTISAYRCCGSLLRQRAMTSHNASGTSGRRSRIGGTFPWVTKTTTSVIVLP
jgi:hypothetical protein